MKRNIKDLKEDKKLLDRLATLKNKEAISGELRENNFDICDKELDELVKFLTKVKINELSDDDLDNVTGGIIPALNSATDDNFVFDLFQGSGSTPGTQCETDAGFVFDLFQGSGSTPGTQCETEIGTNLDILGGNSNSVNKK